MSELAPRETPILAWAVAGMALEDGQSGDLHAVVPQGDAVLVGLIDGLGHGPEAARAALAAGEILQRSAGDPLADVVERCHEGIRHTRGVVMTLASFDGRASLMTWVAVGNVEAILIRAGHAAGASDYEAIQCRGGVVGYRLPPLSVRTLPVGDGDLLVMATDGIRHGFADAVARARRDPDVATALVLAEFAKGSDDALVIAARYLGARP